jgi:hypothetical protein
MNGGTFLAFLLTVLMVVVVAIHREPASVSSEVKTAQPVVVPAPRLVSEAQVLKPPVNDIQRGEGAPVAGPAQKTASSLSSDLKTHGIGCAVAGTAGTGLAVAVGPGEVLAAVGAALLVPVSPVVIGATLGTIFVTGCAVGAWVSPMLAG